MNLGGTVHINKTGCCILIVALVVFFLYMFSNRNFQTTSVKQNQINLRKLLLVAIRAAEYGGREVVGTKDNLIIENKGKTKEGANDSITTADIRSHCVMVNLLRHSFPTIKVISEESTVVCKDNVVVNDTQQLVSNIDDVLVDEKDVKVWIDPLDATQEYTEKLFEYVTTMVCISLQGRPIIGVIHKPFYSTTSWAWVGKAKSSNVEVPKDSSTGTLRFVVSRSHTGTAQDAIEKAFEGRKINITFAGGAGYKTLELVSGSFDAYIHITAIKKWDVCAPNAIINALGGKMTTLRNEEIDYGDSDNPMNSNGIVASLKNHQYYLKF